jgi:mannose-6-phosphate isomerase
MSQLYPLKFEPILKDKIWGGNALSEFYGKKTGQLKNIGESWEISAVSGNLSVVKNGFLAGNNIEEIIEVYLGDITGEAVYEKFGIEFPLLIKLIEAKEDLSVQVHPDNELARKRHNAYGKTEMWYILRSAKDARIYTGFKEKITREVYAEAIKTNHIYDLLNTETALPGDTFFTPAGRIHAIGAGNVLAEIQQTSDITYRIYDWERKDNRGRSRELHTDLAADAIDFNACGTSKIRKDIQLNHPVSLIRCEYFNTNILKVNKAVGRDYNMIDSFVAFICTEGSFLIRWDNKTETVSQGETVLLPAVISNVMLIPEPEATILEIYTDYRQSDTPQKN